MHQRCQLGTSLVDSLACRSATLEHAMATQNQAGSQQQQMSCHSLTQVSCRSNQVLLHPPLIATQPSNYRWPYSCQRQTVAMHLQSCYLAMCRKPLGQQASAKQEDTSQSSPLEDNFLDNFAALSQAAPTQLLKATTAQLDSYGSLAHSP